MNKGNSMWRLFFVFLVLGNGALGDQDTSLEANFQDYQVAQQDLNMALTSLKEHLSPDQYQIIQGEQTHWEKGAKDTCAQTALTTPNHMGKALVQQTCLTKATQDRTAALKQSLVAAQGTSQKGVIPLVYKDFFEPLARAVDFPILLPEHTALQKGLGSSALSNLERTSANSYSIIFATRKGCQDSTCLQGAFLAYRGNVPEGLLSPASQYPDAPAGVPLPGKTIELTAGVPGTLLEGTTGPFPWLSWCGESVCYAMTLKDGTPETLKAVANSAIRHGPWR